MRHTGPRTSIIAAATPTIVYQRDTINLPARTLRLVKLMAYNGQAADIVLEIGTFVAPTFTRRLPRMRVITGMPFTLAEDECPEWIFEGDIYAQASAAAAAPNDVEVQVVVEEIG